MYIVTLIKWISILQLILLYQAHRQAFCSHSQDWNPWTLPTTDPPPQRKSRIDTEWQTSRGMGQTNDCKDRPTHYFSSQQRLRAIRWSIWTDTTVVSTCSLGRKLYLFICLLQVKWLPTIVLPTTTFILAIWTTQTVNRVVIHRWGPCSPPVLIDWIQQEVARGLL